MKKGSFLLPPPNWTESSPVNSPKNLIENVIEGLPLALGIQGLNVIENVIEVP